MCAAVKMVCGKSSDIYIFKMLGSMLWQKYSEGSHSFLRLSFLVLSLSLYSIIILFLFSLSVILFPVCYAWRYTLYAVVVYIDLGKITRDAGMHV